MVRWAGAALAGAIVLVSGSAWAEPSVAVLKFSGRGGSRARARVVVALQGHVRLVPREQVDASARRQGFSLSMPAGRAAVAQDLGVDLFVEGRVRGRRRRARLTLTVYSGRDGTEVASEQIRVRAADFEDRVRSVVEAAAARVAPAEPEPAAEPAGDGLGSMDFGEEPPLEEDDEEGAGGGSPMITALAGFGLRSRSAEVVTRGGAFRRYEGGMFGQFGLRLEANPLAGREDALRGLRLEAGLDMAVGLYSTDPASGDEVSTSAVQWWLEAGYRYQLPDGLHVGGALGFVSDAFTLAENMVLPSSSYPALRIGAAVGYRTMEGKLDVAVRAGYRLTMGVGDLAPAFGAEASASGWDLGLVGRGALPSGISYGLEVGYRRTSIDFEGDAQDSPGRSGSDGSFSLQVFGGYSL